MSTEELETAALSLPAKERASLARKLIESIDVDPTAEVEEAWSREVEQRVQDVLEGAVELVPGEQVFQNALARRRQQ